MGNVVNRVFESSGPEGKVRGTPQQIIEKYNQLARDAQLGNDRVAFENFQQHAEHYTRMLGEAMREQEARAQQQGGQGGGDQGQRDYRRDEPDDRRRFDEPRGGEERGEERSDDRGDDHRGREDDQRDRQEHRGRDDVIDTVEDDHGGLVETPEGAPAEPSEAAPAPKPRRRRPRKSADGSAGEGGQDVKPEAAE